MDRIYNYQMTSTFIPTSLLWLLAYSTLYIKLEQFNVRFMGTVTSLLVLASLLNSISKSLPSTSYFKFIDLWFLWYLANIFCIVIYHVYANSRKQPSKENVSLGLSHKVLEVKECGKAKNGLQEGSSELQGTSMKQKQTLSNNRRMRKALFLFPMEILCFNVIYFWLTTN